MTDNFGEGGAIKPPTPEPPAPPTQGEGANRLGFGHAGAILTWLTIVVTIGGGAIWIANLRADLDGAHSRLDSALAKNQYLCESLKRAEAKIIDNYIISARAIGPLMVSNDIPREVALDRAKHQNASEELYLAQFWSLSTEETSKIFGDSTCGVQSP